MIRQKSVNSVDAMEVHDEVAVTVLPAAGGAEEATKPRRGGPRTPMGKQRSRYNALRNGFFAKEAAIHSPFFSESKKEFREVLRELIRERQPQGITEMNLVEFAATQLLKLRRLQRAEQALILERHIPKDANPGPSAPTSWKEHPDLLTVFARERARIEKMRKSLPNFDDLEWIQRYETHIWRQYYRALAELERRQKERLGTPDPHKFN